MFLRAAWYPVAWEREIGDVPHAVVALGERIVVFRSGAGEYTAKQRAYLANEPTL